MSPEEPEVVVGSRYGSAIGLFLALSVPILCVSVPLAATRAWSWAAPVAVVLVGLVGAPWIRRNSTLSVSDEGVTLLRFGRLAFVPWSNVESVADGWFPALVFTEPQQVGLRRVGRLRFDGFDPNWRSRRTTVAIGREFARSRSPSR